MHSLDTQQEGVHQVALGERNNLPPALPWGIGPQGVVHRGLVFPGGLPQGSPHRADLA